MIIARHGSRSPPLFLCALGAQPWRSKQMGSMPVAREPGTVIAGRWARSRSEDPTQRGTEAGEEHGETIPCRE